MFFFFLYLLKNVMKHTFSYFFIVYSITYFSSHSENHSSWSSCGVFSSIWLNSLLAKTRKFLNLITLLCFEFSRISFLAGCYHSWKKDFASPSVNTTNDYFYAKKELRLRHWTLFYFMIFCLIIFFSSSIFCLAWKKNIFTLFCLPKLNLTAI